MPVRTCAECGTEFEYKPSQPTRECCSTSCAAKLRNRRLKAEGRLFHPVKPRRGTEHPCEVCGKPVYRNKSQTSKGLGRFCSQACHNLAQTAPPVVKVCALDGCENELRLKPSQAARLYCSKEHEGLARIKRPLDRTYNGRPAKKDDAGYVMLWEPDHPNKSQKGWQYEHRLVVEGLIGRYLTSEEHVDHINQVKDDNSPLNLQVLSVSDHSVKTVSDLWGGIAAMRAELAEYRRRYGPLT